MISVNIKQLLDRLNTTCRSALEKAAGTCVSRTHYEITSEHVLMHLLAEPGADLALILDRYDIRDTDIKVALNRVLETFPTGNGARPVFSPRLIELVQDALLTASVELGQDTVRSGALLLTLLKKPMKYTDDLLYREIRLINPEDLTENFTAVTRESREKPDPKPVSPDQGEVREDRPPADQTALAKYCEDFTQKAKQGNIDPVFGRDREIRQMIDIFARRRKNNPIVVGEAGVGKTAVVEGLALRIVNSDVPDFLKNVRLLGLDMGLLQAGAGMKGEFENRLKKVIAEVKASPTPVIMFIDEVHTIIGAGGSQGGSDAANLLKPALARGELRTVAATTWSEYKKYFEKDAALARRFQLVHLDEPTVDTATLILRGLKKRYEQTHGVVIRDDAVRAAAEFSDRYISGRYLPDKAIDLLDTSSARVKVLLTAKPGRVEDLERSIQALEREQAALERDLAHGIEIDSQRLEDIIVLLNQKKTGLEEVTQRWDKEKELAATLIRLREARHTGEKAVQDPEEASPLPEQLAEDLPEEKSTEDLDREIQEIAEALETLQGEAPLVTTQVDPDIVAKVVSDWTGIPVGQVVHDEARTIMDLESDVGRRIKGQEEAVSRICRIIKASKAGLSDPDQPMGIFLLTGPSGVGKTETGLALADLLFGGERFTVSINMSEFQEKHTVSRLIGSPPGYVGYGEGGVLTEAVRQRPYSVVILDESEKANHDVMNLFYQVFDKGELSDGEGRRIDFKNTLIFLTSNLGSDTITQMCRSEETPSADDMVSAIRPLLSEHFKPALLARMSIVPYRALDTDVLKEIVDIKLGRLADRMAASHRIKLSFSQAVVSQIAARCLEVETGARNIDHIMNGSILPIMSRQILEMMSKDQLPGHLVLDAGEDGSFMLYEAASPESEVLN